MNTDHETEQLLSALREAIRTQMGLEFRADSDEVFKKKIASACKELGAPDVSICIRQLLLKPLSRHAIEVLASHLTIGETYFFRDRKLMAALTGQLLPELIKRKESTSRTIRIWSAGCCTGEEPYTLAMLLLNEVRDIEQWNITILATDINIHFLEKALHGSYTEWSFRDTPEWARSRFFEKADQRSWRLQSRVKEMVTFSYLNLAEDTYPSLLNNTNAMDLIICRNVLMYFSRSMQAQVIERFFHSLVEGGYLIVSPSEVSSDRFPQFDPVTFDDSVVYVKNTQAPRKRRSSIGTSALSAEQGTESKDWSSYVEVVVGISQKTEESPGQRDLSQEKATPTPVTQEKNPSASAKDFQSRERRDALFASDKRGSYYQAEYFYRLGEYARALDELRRCEEEPKVLQLITRVCADSGDFTAALEWCEKLIMLDRLSAKNYFLQATILEEMNHLQQAIDALRRALFLDPHYILAHFSLANSLRRIGSNEALVYYENARTLLKALPCDALVPDSDGLPAGRLLELIELNERTKVP